MRRFALIGDPVGHSLSPVMHNAAFAAAGIDARYEAVRVTIADLGALMRHLANAYEGFNVTTPLKEAVLPFVSEMSGDASRAGAVNTVRVRGGGVAGHNTDGIGFVAAIADIWQLAPRGLGVCILGSGPAARAIARALHDAGAARVDCWSRNAATAAEIGPAPVAGADLVVSALPQSAVIPPGILDAVGGARYVFDVNYSAKRSPVPKEIGEHRTDGLPLLLHQGALSFEWWTGVKAPLAAMRTALAGAM